MNAENAVLEITRIFDAPPGDVFDAWMIRDQWQAWIGPEGVRCEVPLLESREGGSYRLTMHLANGTSIPVAGEFRKIEPGKSIVFTWGMEGDSKLTLVTVLLRDLAGRTELTLRQEGLPTPADREGNAKGWRSAFNKLATFLNDCERRPAAAKS